MNSFLCFVYVTLRPSRNLCQSIPCAVDWTNAQMVILLCVAPTYQPLCSVWTTGQTLHHLINIHEPSFSNHLYAPAFLDSDGRRMTVNDGRWGTKKAQFKPALNLRLFHSYLNFFSVTFYKRYEKDVRSKRLLFVIWGFIYFFSVILSS